MVWLQCVNGWIGIGFDYAMKVVLKTFNKKKYFQCNELYIGIDNELRPLIIFSLIIYLKLILHFI